MDESEKHVSRGPESDWKATFYLSIIMLELGALAICSILQTIWYMAG
jgi:hypothetical protein